MHLKLALAIALDSVLQRVVAPALLWHHPLDSGPLALAPEHTELRAPLSIVLHTLPSPPAGSTAVPGAHKYSK